MLVELPSLAAVRAYEHEARRMQAAGALPAGIEIVAAARTILFADVDDCASLAQELRAWQPPAAEAASGGGREVRLPVVYDGPDLPEVARLWGVSPAEAVELHTGWRHEVAFIGFSPGFAYIAGLPDERRVPRLERPRTAVPRGSVALADEFTGIYPRPSPGGWRLIGRTEAEMWDATRTPPALLAPGDVVVFVPLDR